MNDMGGGCYPSVERLAKLCSLSERSVCTHIDVAEKDGWLLSKVHGFNGQGWARKEYVPQWPKGVELGADENQKGVELGAEGVEPDDKKALNYVQSNIPSNISKEVPIKKAKRNATTRTSYEKQFGEYPATIPDELWTAAASGGFTADTIDTEWAAFSEWHVAKGSTWAGDKGWRLSWLKWCRNTANRSRGYRDGGKPSGGLAAAFGASVAARYGISPTGSGVGGGQTTRETGTDTGGEFDSEGRRIIPF